MLDLLKRKKKDTKQSNLNKEFRIVLEEVERAKEAFRVAELQYDNCDSEFIDIAIENLNIARRRVDLSIKKYKVLLNQA